MPIWYLFSLQEKRDSQEREDAQERQENMTYVPFTCCNVFMVIIMMVTCSSAHSPYVILYLSLRDTIGEFPVFPDTHLAIIIIITVNLKAFGQKQTNKQSTNACISPETTSLCGRNVHLNDIELLVTR